ncbi:MAG: permease-like cell division protein FtsX [Gemmatimonadota bacterium]
MYALREALAAVRRAPVLVGLSAGMVALALFVVGLFTLAAYNLHVALATLEERVEVVAYIRDEASSPEVEVAIQELTRLGEVERVQYVSKDQALEQARRELPEFQEIFTGLNMNPLPASLEIKLSSGFRGPEAVSRVAGMAEAYPFVEDVRFGQDWVDRLFLLRRLAGITSGVLGLSFAVVAALIIATAIRIALFARREEIHIMRLVGARDGFIRRPFLLEGAATGLVGGALAVGFTWGAYWVGYRWVFAMEWLPTLWVMGGILMGAVFGLLASALALRRYLREV